MKTEVFIRTFCKHPIRLHLAEACIERWKEQADADVCLLMAKDSLVPRPSIRTVRIDEPDFWRAAKQAAEDLSVGPVYVLIDDDHLIAGEWWIREGRRILDAHPEFLFISARSFNEEFPDRNVADPDVFDVNCAGAPYFIRKGSVEKFPTSLIHHQDTTICDALRARGFKMGMCRQLRYNHLGRGYSTEQLCWWNHP